MSTGRPESLPRKPDRVESGLGDSEAKHRARALPAQTRSVHLPGMDVPRARELNGRQQAGASDAIAVNERLDQIVERDRGHVVGAHPHQVGERLLPFSGFERRAVLLVEAVEYGVAVPAEVGSPPAVSFAPDLACS